MKLVTKYFHDNFFSNVKIIAENIVSQVLPWIQGTQISISNLEFKPLPKNGEIVSSIKMPTTTNISVEILSRIYGTQY